MDPMKRKLQTILSASAASLLALSAVAQDTQGTSSVKKEQRDESQHSTDKLRGAAKLNDLIGMTVKNQQEETLGKVQDLAVDAESGRIVQVIVSTGGYLGIGDTLSAVPPTALHHDVAQNILRLDANKEKLKGAPPFEMAKWSDYSDSKHLSEVYRHYGVEPTFKFVYQDDADGTSDKDRVVSSRQTMIPASRLAHLQRASQLIGMPVKNLQDQKVGTVDNLTADLASGRIVAFIISTGGFLGMGDELSAVPPTALRFTKERDTLQLDASKEMLAGAPHFKASSWPDMSKPDYSEGIYSAYKVAPYFAINKTVNADNTALNGRDRDAKTLTPLDQGNSETDVKATADIRKQIMASSNVSINAQNVKIITRDGKVTLRGPVNNVEEKTLIGEIATKIVKEQNVDNQLEVKLASSSN
ncbi:MAG: hypothetical protein RL693_2535 [Verrucomicrobiota bacterium]